MRWYLFLSRFNFKFKYSKGEEIARADALSNPTHEDPSVQDRTMRLLRSTEDDAVVNINALTGNMSQTK